jgi:hypothetical protein
MMPRDASGYYTLPSSNPVASGTVIESTWANETMDDIAAQLNNVVTRDGLLGPTGSFLFADGSVSAPGIAFSSQPATGIWRNTASGSVNISVNGSGVFAVGATSTHFGTDRKITADWTTNFTKFETSISGGHTFLYAQPALTGTGSLSVNWWKSLDSAPAFNFAGVVGTTDETSAEPGAYAGMSAPTTAGTYPFSIKYAGIGQMHFWGDKKIAIAPYTMQPRYFTGGTTWGIEMATSGYGVGRNTAGQGIALVANVFATNASGTEWATPAPGYGGATAIGQEGFGVWYTSQSTVADQVVTPYYALELRHTDKLMETPFDVRARTFTAVPGTGLATPTPGLMK